MSTIDPPPETGTFEVECPTCGADPRDHCHDAGDPRPHPHVTRQYRARRDNETYQGML